MSYVRKESTGAGAGDLALWMCTPCRVAENSGCLLYAQGPFSPMCLSFKELLEVPAPWDSGTAASTVARPPPKGSWGILRFPFCWVSQAAERECLASVRLRPWERTLPECSWFKEPDLGLGVPHRRQLRPQQQ